MNITNRATIRTYACIGLFTGEDLDAAFGEADRDLLAFGEEFEHVGVGFQTSEQLPADFDIVFDHVAEIDGAANNALEQLAGLFDADHLGTDDQGDRFLMMKLALNVGELYGLAKRGDQ